MSKIEEMISKKVNDIVGDCSHGNLDRMAEDVSRKFRWSKDEARKILNDI